MSNRSATPLGTFPRALGTPGAQLEPFDWYDEQRTSGPVHYDDVRGCFDVFDYDGVRRVLADHETFSSDPLTNPENDAGNLSHISRSMLHQDPPRHTELRGVVDDLFRPGAVKALAPDIESIAHDLLDEAEAASRNGRFDLVEAFAYPFPVVVIAGLLGVPPEDRERFREWSTAIVAASERGDDGQEEMQTAYRELYDYFGALLRDRREDPREDLLSRIVAAGDLSTEALLGFCILLLVAGNVTTTNLLSSAVRCFAERDLFDDLREDPDALEHAIEEVLRYRSPVQAMQRWTTDDVVLGGHEIPRGTSVVAWMGAANRDPDAFEDASSFVIDRHPNRHVAFGHGIHHCLGASLARLEARTALTALSSRFERLDLATEDLSPSGSMMVYGPRSLPVGYEVAR